MEQGCGEGDPDSYKRLLQGQLEPIPSLPPTSHPSLHGQIRGAQETDVTAEGVRETQEGSQRQTGGGESWVWLRWVGGGGDGHPFGHR